MPSQEFDSSKMVSHGNGGTEEAENIDYGARRHDARRAIRMKPSCAKSKIWYDGMNVFTTNILR